MALLLVAATAALVVMAVMVVRAVRARLVLMEILRLLMERLVVTQAPVVSVVKAAPVVPQ